MNDKQKMPDMDKYTTALVNIAKLLGNAENWDGAADYLENIANYVALAGLPHPGCDYYGDEYDEALEKAMDHNHEAESPVLTAMTEYAQAVRGNWSERALRMAIDGWVRELRQPDPSHDIEWHRRNLDICMAGGGHWCGNWGYCDDKCGCEPCAEDRSEP